MSPAKKANPSGRRRYVERPKTGAGGVRTPPRKQGRAVVGASLSDGSAMTVLGASRVLGVSEKRVRQFIESGDLEALDLPKADESGKRIPTQITTNSVIALRTKRGSKGAMPPEKVREKLSKPSQVETQLKALSEQVAALAMSLKALEAANSEARLARERAFELEQRVLDLEKQLQEAQDSSSKRRRWWQR